MRRQLKDSVIALASAHPDWTPEQVAEFLDCGPAYVRKAAARYGLKFQRRRFYQVRRAVPDLKLSDAVVEKLRRYAKARGISAAILAGRLIETCINENMVDAVLDDEVAA